ncbi:unnamed protein product [Leptosia nina]|uniref:Threonyl/alanyl tRNA synthetase SAD domain-containing protein n=1 Tax=Leptosia nina TaxID=320188 RepID=A0AAV1J616_9NEOP
MVFMCQENSFLKEYTSKVLKCEPTKEPIIEYGKSTKFEGYQITLENTILFPAGGGQPHDLGWLNEVEVLQVLRKGEDALHFTKEPIEVGTFVTQKINWDRRFDHMQQHSGQHLLSAILEKDYNLPTTSWWLGCDESYVELDTISVENKTIETVEEKCNLMIRSALPVDVKICKASDPDLNKEHTKSLPKDCTDTLRIICIGDVDENMCCGTHVSNLSQLQMIKLLGYEPGKKGKTNLRFLVGNRVTKVFQSMLDREKVLVGLLKAICKGLENDGLFIFCASEEPDKTKEGQIIIQGAEEHCNILGPQVIEVLKAKGAFKNGKFQGKATDLSGINKCRKIIEDYFCKK